MRGPERVGRGGNRARQIPLEVVDVRRRVEGHAVAEADPMAEIDREGLSIVCDRVVGGEVWDDLVVRAKLKQLAVDRVEELRVPYRGVGRWVESRGPAAEATPSSTVSVPPRCTCAASPERA